LIWGIDTLFKLHAGLDIFQVMLTNAAFTLGNVLFEIPTGVVADTLGRRVSLLLCLVTLFATTLLYVAIAREGWGFWPVMWVSVCEVGYTPRTLELARVPAEMRRAFVEGLRYGVHHPVVRPVMLGSLVTMTFMIFGYYSWQRYFLDLLGRDAVWVSGVIAAL